LFRESGDEIPDFDAAAVTGDIDTDVHGSRIWATSAMGTKWCVATPRSAAISSA
jgi:hypothetical protein